MHVREFADADGVQVVALEGEVDLHHSPELRAVLTLHADARRAALLVDFSGVTYIDSSGLATLIEYVQQVMPHGGRLVLGGVSARLRTIFDIARLGEVFGVHATVAEAKAALTA